MGFKYKFLLAILDYFLINIVTKNAESPAVIAGLKGSYVQTTKTVVEKFTKISIEDDEMPFSIR